MRKLTPTQQLKDLKLAIEADIAEMTTELKIAVKGLEQATTAHRKAA